MQIQNQAYRTIWPNAEHTAVTIIDQTQLPFKFELAVLTDVAAMVHAIKTMQVRGAPLIGASAAYGMALAARQDASEPALQQAAAILIASRPTAVNLSWAVQRILSSLLPLPQHQRNQAAWLEAAKIADEDVALNQSIAQHGLTLIQQAAAKNPQRALNILTHCNAGWLAAVDWGTALAPIYAAHNAGIALHVWVDETRPRNQGASLTAWELAQHGVPHTVISDNAGGHLMQHGLVDMAIVGADRVTSQGDVCNKIGTYLKALAAHDNGIPFYAAVPSPTIDWSMQDGRQEIEIENRSADEVAYIAGLAQDGTVQRVRIMPAASSALNPAFDVTPARLVTAIITERGVCAPHQLRSLFPC
jgi:methylthioribose-1-phosphate isomerase